jgi:hypothetical protein
VATIISVINASTVLTDGDVAPVVDALQRQVNEDWEPVWGSDADLVFVPSTDLPDPATWWLSILDDSDQAGALGYHDVTSAGLPLGKVFARTDIINGYQWTVTASHELLEMLGDPDINLTAFVQTNNTTGTLYAYEVCDACEDDSFGYDNGDGILLSDFVFPAWFESFLPPGGAQFDFRNQIQQPFELLPGGYIGVFDVYSGSGWYQVTAETKPGGGSFGSEVRPRVGSRRERRRTPRTDWIGSAPPDRIQGNMRKHQETVQRLSEAVLSRRR